MQYNYIIVGILTKFSYRQLNHGHAGIQHFLTDKVLQQFLAGSSILYYFLSDNHAHTMRTMHQNLQNRFSLSKEDHLFEDNFWFCMTLSEMQTYSYITFLQTTRLITMRSKPDYVEADLL